MCRGELRGRGVEEGLMYELAMSISYPFSCGLLVACLLFLPLIGFILHIHPNIMTVPKHARR
jgi:hypothetical protein